jgi:hypothetical protein
MTTVANATTAARWAQTTDEEEERKRLMAVALAGDIAVCIDNITHPFGSGPLDMALTAGSIRDRIMATHKVVEAPWNAIVFATGNNMTFKGDTIRRTVLIDLDPRMENPEERTGFRHKRLLQWVRQERPRLLMAALTILRAYFEAGTPGQGLTPIGSFEAWSDLIRSALVWAGEPDPVASRAGLEAENNQDFVDWETLLRCWETCYGTHAKTLRQAANDIGSMGNAAITNAPANKWDELSEALAAFDHRYTPGKSLDLRTVGNGLRKWLGRVIGNTRLVRSSAQGNTRGTAYTIETV